MLIYLKTLKSKFELESYLEKLANDRGVVFKKNNVGTLWLELFGTDTFYKIVTEPNKTRFFPRGSIDVYATTEDVSCECDEVSSDKITAYQVDTGLMSPEDFESKIDKYGIWYYTDGETYWIGPDDSEAASFERRCRMSDMSVNEVIIVETVDLKEVG